jgi:hypothetical protein
MYVLDQFGQKLKKGDFAVVFSSVESDAFLCEIISTDRLGNVDMLVHHMHDDSKRTQYSMNVDDMVIVKYDKKTAKRILIKEELSQD